MTTRGKKIEPAARRRKKNRSKPIRLYERTVKPAKGRPEGYTQSWLVVPPEIAALIPEGSEFRCELTDEGVLFRRIEQTIDYIPNWATGRGEPT